MNRRDIILQRFFNDLGYREYILKFEYFHIVFLHFHVFQSSD